MPYGVWVSKVDQEPGITKYKIDGMPPFPNRVAIKLTDEEVLVAKHLRGIVVFDSVESDVQRIDFEGTTYHCTKGIWNPPIKDDIYARMKNEGLV